MCPVVKFFYFVAATVIVMTRCLNYRVQTAAKVELNARRGDDNDDDAKKTDDGASVVQTSQLLAEARRERTRSRSAFSRFQRMLVIAERGRNVYCRLVNCCITLPDRICKGL